MTWTPPTIPARQPGWEGRLLATLGKHRDAPFVWGNSDCLIVAADLARAMTGVDPMKGYRRYRTEGGAARLLDQLGCSDIEDALALVFPPIAPAMAWRGDCGIVEQERAGEVEKLCVVFAGELAMARSPLGSAFLKRGRVVRAYAIGAR